MGECDYCNHKGELYSTDPDRICESCWEEEESGHTPLELEDLER